MDRGYIWPAVTGNWYYSIERYGLLCMYPWLYHGFPLQKEESIDFDDDMLDDFNFGDLKVSCLDFRNIETPFTLRYLKVWLRR